MDGYGNIGGGTFHLPLLSTQPRRLLNVSAEIMDRQSLIQKLVDKHLSALAWIPVSLRTAFLGHV